MRAGEVLALRCDDVTLDAGREALRVREPKNVARLRPAPLQRLPAPRTARAVLCRQRPQVRRRAGQRRVLQQPGPQACQPLVQGDLDRAERRPRVLHPPLREPAQHHRRFLRPSRLQHVPSQRPSLLRTHPSIVILPPPSP